MLLFIFITKNSYNNYIEGYENSTMSSEPPSSTSTSTSTTSTTSLTTSSVPPPPPPSSYTSLNPNDQQPKPFELKTMQLPMICPVCPSSVIISKGEIEQQKLNDAIKSNASQEKIAASYLAANSNLHSQVGEYVSGNGGLSDSSSGYIVRPYVDPIRSFV